jgi:hypothetical protein
MDRRAPKALQAGKSRRVETLESAAMLRTHGDMRFLVFAGVWALLLAAVPPAIPISGDEPPALNPFSPVKQDREDAVPGYLEMSDGKVYAGSIYMTRDKRLKLLDAQLERQREIPLRVVREIECKVKKEWMEKEWRFKELALDEKMYTGRTYPAREYTHTITLKDGRRITGDLAEIIYVRPFFESTGGPMPDPSQLQPERFLLLKRDKGEAGTDLKTLLYVRAIKLGQDALEEGKQKAAGKPGSKSAPGEKVKAKSKRKTPAKTVPAESAGQ